MIDQKEVISEKFSNDGKGLEKHLELGDVFGTACEVAFFYQKAEQSSFKEKEGQSLVVKRSAIVNLAEIPITDNILTCQSGLRDPIGNFGCSLKPKGDKDTQKQYLLALRDFLRDRHKMAEDAVLRTISKEIGDRWSREVIEFYEVKGNNLSCRVELTQLKN